MATLSSNQPSNYGTPITPPGLADDEATVFGIRLSTWIKTAVLVVLFALLFWPNLRRLWDKTNPFYGEDNWKHAPFVPLVGLYYLYLNREKLRQSAANHLGWSLKHILLGTAIEFSPWLAFGVAYFALGISNALWAIVVLEGILFLDFVVDVRGFRPARSWRLKVRALFLGGETSQERSWQACKRAIYILARGIELYCWAIWPGQNDWFKDIGMITTLFGVVTLLCGWEAMKIAWFPIVFLICAAPWPGAFYSELAGPLQKLAARVSVHALNFFGVNAWQGATPMDQPHGTKIYIMNKEPAIRVLNIAEACSGLRALMTFVTIAGAIAFLSFRPLWQRIIMVMSAVPIAIFCNTLRITVQGIFDRYVSTQWSESFAHAFLGLLMMIPAFFLILLVGWVLQNILIDEVDDKTSLRRYGKSKKGHRRSSSVLRVAAVPRPSQAAFAPRAARTSPGSTNKPGRDDRPKKEGRP